MTASPRAASLLAGLSLALMTLIAPLGVMIALPAGATGLAGLIVLVVAILDVLVAVGLYFVLRAAAPLLAAAASALRIAYAAVFAAAGGFLLSPADAGRFEAVWDAGLLVFGAHLVVVGVIITRSEGIPTWIGVLVLIAGLGYAADTVIAALTPDVTFSLGQFVFAGELILLIWLIGWGGRTRRAAGPRTMPAAAR